MLMKNFTTMQMIDIIPILQENLKNLQPKEKVQFEVINPDVATSIYSGTKLHINNKEYIYRSYKSWLDLAQSLNCRMLTPKVASEYSIIMTYELLNPDVSFHTQEIQKEEKYGQESIFSQIHKNEESSFLFHYIQALNNVNLPKRHRILNLGVNSADEFEVIQQYTPNFKELELVGIDYCSSAISAAQEKFAHCKNIQFIECDINALNELELQKFDLIISIGTLQSSNLEFNKLFMSIVQNQLKREGALILGFPNCRWIDGEMIYGARVKNYSFSEMGLLYKDAIFAKKYLQQKKFRVTLTGKDYIFLTATSIRK